MATSKESYQSDFTEVRAALQKRIEARAKDNQFLETELPTIVDEALRTTWAEGISLTEWTEMAANAAHL